MSDIPIVHVVDKHLKMQCYTNPVTDDIHINIVVPRFYVLQAKVTRESREIGRMVDMPQFFGMLEDAICTKLGIEKPKTDSRGHNVEG